MSDTPKHSAPESGGGTRRAGHYAFSPRRILRTAHPPVVLSSSATPSDEGRVTSSPLAAEERAVCDAIAASLARREWNDPHTRAAVAAYARRSHDLGVEPGPLVVAIKRLLRERALPQASEWLIDVITSRAVLWAIEAYFER
jgi:hypothetical protein